MATTIVDIDIDLKMTNSIIKNLVSRYFMIMYFYFNINDYYIFN